MKYTQTIPPLALGLIASASAQESSSTLLIPGPMEQSVTAISGTRTEVRLPSAPSLERSYHTYHPFAAMTSSASDSSSPTSSAGQASLASSVIVNAGNPGGDTTASATSSGTSAGDPGNGSRMGFGAAQNSGNDGAVGARHVVLLGMGLGAAVFV